MLGHWGEMLLFWLDRADSLSRIAGLPNAVTHYIRTNFHITASGMLNPALLRQHPSRDEIDSFLTHFATDEDRQKFTATNAATLYGLDLWLDL